MLCSAICLFCVATRDHRCPRQRFPSHRIAAFGERRPTATEWQLFKQLQRAHSAFKRTPGSSGGGFQGVQFTVAACCIPSYFRGFFSGRSPWKKGHISPTDASPIHSNWRHGQLSEDREVENPSGLVQQGRNLWILRGVPIIITETGGEAVMSRGAL